jgi:hypothetical protein
MPGRMRSLRYHTPYGILKNSQNQKSAPSRDRRRARQTQRTGVLRHLNALPLRPRTTPFDHPDWLFELTVSARSPALRTGLVGWSPAMAIALPPFRNLKDGLRRQSLYGMLCLMARLCAWTILAAHNSRTCFSGIQVTADICLIPGANVSFVDRLDLVREEPETPQQNATQAQLVAMSDNEVPSEVADLTGGGGWTRTNDLRIMRPSL